MMTKRTLLLVTAFVALAAPALAQFETATVLGSVRDKSDALVPGATVTLLNLDTGVAQTKVSDAAGNYEFFTVRIGTYKVTAELDGFAPSVADQVRVTVGSRQRVDLVLSPGTVSEAVEVTAEVSPLEKDSSQRGQVITHEQAVALPLNGREYSALALLTTGVRLSALNTGSASTVREGSFNVNGLRSTFNNFLLDGIDNNAYGTSNQGFSNQVMQPPPDAVAEFKVVTNNMSAEYGRAGGATINVAYQSGGNRFQGAAWEFFRDTSLNATGFFKPTTGDKPPLRRNQFGFVLGGPIVKNKAFFFVDYEGFRQTRENVAFGTIPTPAQRSGILTVPVRNPQTGATYPAGTPIPMTPFAAEVLAGIPDPTRSGTANNYQTVLKFTNNNNKYSGKVDYQVSPNLRAFARFGYRDVDITDQSLLPLPSGGAGNGLTYVTSKQLATGLTWTRGDRELFEFRFAWSSTLAGKNPPALGEPGAQEAYGISGLPTDPRVSGGLPTQLISGYADLGRQATNPQWQFPVVWNPKLNYTRSLGRHSLKLGIEFQHVQTEVQDVNPLYGRDEYAGRFSRPVGSTSTDNQYNLADFMFGLRSRYALTNFFIANLRQNLYFGYLQDDFKVNRKLTLNLGLRYEYATPQWERDNLATNFDPVTRTMVTATNDDRYLVDSDKNNLGPRLGFAYAIDDKTVARGGYGIAYIHFHRAGGGNVLPINGPQVINAVVSQANPLAPGFRPTEQGYPEGLTDPSRFVPTQANITYMPRDNKTSSVQSWFFSVQRELLKNIVVDVAYVGNSTKDTLLFANYNQATPNNAAGTIPLAARRPIPEYGDITYAFNGGFSRYNAFQMRLEGRRGSLAFLSSLTLSKATDNGAGTLENPNGDRPGPQDFYNLADNEGTSAYDQPWNSTTSLVWQLPFFKHNKWLGGWQLAAINNMWAGETINFTYAPAAAFQVSGITQDFRGANNYRPNITCDPTLPADQRSVTNYFNRDCVQVPTDPSQPFGNSKRNSARGDAIYQLDLALSKTFPIRGESRLEFRLEAFNVLNKTNFRAANGNRSSAAFGSITATYDPRQLQLGAKLSF
ncbi:MAG: carboxypeptidase regulatory-like domain-containing protein [Vicinamibacteria bacterium]